MNFVRDHGSSGGGGDDGALEGFEQELSDIDKQIRKHALLCSTGFIILLPLGALIARYIRTFTRSWFWAHAIVQFLIAGPIIFAGWAYGYKTTSQLNTGGHFVDTHKKIGLCLLCIYLVQLALGLIIHFFKPPASFLRGHRPPQNYFHAFFGLAIIALAFYQVHYGITIEWVEGTGDGTVVPRAAMRAWEALLIVFFVMYFLGLAFLPRQYSQEAGSRRQRAAREKM